mmetsp:Transcript_4035/g.7732  ORF Transcript_4035/g.7732 Transcript_4035/m.7732 type:complete len:270 (+) Transcript_4035:132-941(+)
MQGSREHRHTDPLLAAENFLRGCFIKGSQHRVAVDGFLPFQIFTDVGRGYQFVALAEEDRGVAGNLFCEERHPRPWKSPLDGPVHHDVGAYEVADVTRIGHRVDELFGEEGLMEAEADGIDEDQPHHRLRGVLAAVAEPRGAVGVSHEDGPGEPVGGQHGGEGGGDVVRRDDRLGGLPRAKAGDVGDVREEDGPAEAQQPVDEGEVVDVADADAVAEDHGDGTAGVGVRVEVDDGILALVVRAIDAGVVVIGDGSHGEADEPPAMHGDS